MNEAGTFIIVSLAIALSNLLLGIYYQKYSFSDAEESQTESTKATKRFIRNRIIFTHHLRDLIWPTESIHSEWHPLYRHERFPSVEERVKIYMHDWYKPHDTDINNNDTFHYFYTSSNFVLIFEPADLTNFSKYIAVSDEVLSHKPIILKEATLKECARKSLFSKTPSIAHYCDDTLDLLKVRESSDLSEPSSAPLISWFGDRFEPLHFPTFGKCRLTNVLSKDTKVMLFETNRTGPMPIIYKLNSKRHYGLIHIAKWVDTPWYLKKNMAVFRGAYTGFINETVGEEERCFQNTRCSFVINTARSQLIDAALTRKVLFKNTNEINGISLFGENYNMRELQEYKIIISLEGNDVSSGLKWILLSKSVVLMPSPKYTSWAMEEELIPWVHYVPIKEDGTDAESKVRWVLEHDEEALRISERGTLFMEDFLFHPDAVKDDLRVKQEIVYRYEKLWQELDSIE